MNDKFSPIDSNHNKFNQKRKFQSVSLTYERVFFFFFLSSCFLKKVIISQQIQMSCCTPGTNLKIVCQLYFNFKKSENSKVDLDYFKNY